MAGAEPVPVRTPMIEELVAAYLVIVGNEAYTTHAGWLAERPQDYQPLIRELLLSFADRPAREYIGAQRTRHQLVAAPRAALDRAGEGTGGGGVDVVLPTTRIRATPIGAPTTRIDGTDVPVRPALLALNSPFNPDRLAGGARSGAGGRAADRRAGRRRSGGRARRAGCRRGPGTSLAARLTGGAGPIGDRSDSDSGS